MRPSNQRRTSRAVGPLRGRGQPEQDARLQVLEQPCVGRRLGVVELVDDHHVERVRVELVEAAGASDWIEAKTWSQLPDARRRPAARRSAPSSSTWRKTRWLCSRISLRWATKSSALEPACPQPPVVERRDHRLAGAGRRDDQVAVVAALPLGVERLEDLAPGTGRADVEAQAIWRRRPRRRSAPSAACSRSPSAPGS